MDWWVHGKPPNHQTTKPPMGVICCSPTDFGAGLIFCLLNKSTKNKKNTLPRESLPAAPRGKSCSSPLLPSRRIGVRTAGAGDFDVVKNRFPPPLLILKGLFISPVDFKRNRRHCWKFCFSILSRGQKGKSAGNMFFSIFSRGPKGKTGNGGL